MSKLARFLCLIVILLPALLLAVWLIPAVSSKPATVSSGQTEREAALADAIKAIGEKDRATGADTNTPNLTSDPMTDPPAPPDILEPVAVTKLTASDARANDYFGTSIAVSGDTVIVGAPVSFSGGPSNNGAAYIFVREGAGWAFQQKLTSPDSPAGDRDGFGQNVSISGDTVVVSAPRHDLPDEQTGAVYVFVRSNSSWTLQKKLTPANTPLVEAESFSGSVAISGNTLLIRAVGLLKSAPDVDQGMAHVFVRNGAVWTLQATLTSGLPGNELSQFFGYSTAISGDFAVVGDPYTNSGSTESEEAAYIFVRCGTEWTLQQRLTPSDGSADRQFGIAVAITGDTVVVGAEQDRSGNRIQGASYAYVNDGETWIQQQKLTADDGGLSSRFGKSVAILGNTIIVGKPVQAGTPANVGSAFLFGRSGSNWSLQQTLTAGDGQAGDEFGSSLAISNNAVFVGATFDDAGSTQTNEGSAYAIDLSTQSLPSLEPPCETDLKVNVASDEPDADLEDDVCDADLMAVGQQCTLRAAIQTANDRTGPDTITFDIPGSGLRTISPAVVLPEISGPVSIDGASQPGYTTTPLIELNGTGVSGSGFVLAAGSNGSVIRALTINRFTTAGIEIRSNENQVEDCFIGLLADGNSFDAASRQLTGVVVTGARNRIGGPATEERGSNLITGNAFDQVLIKTAAAVENVVAGNDIGQTLNRERHEFESTDGVVILDGASRNRVGGSSATDINFIDHFYSYAVIIACGANDNTVVANAISASSVGVGIVQASNNTIGGSITDQFNLSRNAIIQNGIGIFIGDLTAENSGPLCEESSPGHTFARPRSEWRKVRSGAVREAGPIQTRDNNVLGNLIGLLRDFDAAENEWGIQIGKAENTRIGTGEFGFHNFISANIFDGILVDNDAIGTQIKGNFIGVDITGNIIRPNRNGVVLRASNSLIERNVISGNNDFGILLQRADDTDPIPAGNTITNNKIGTKGGDGQLALPNDESGIFLNGNNNTVTQNLISGNTRYGIDIRGGGNTISENRIGTNINGNEALANMEGGIIVNGSTNLLEANLISGNANAGITIVRDSAVSPVPPAFNIVRGNFIGTNASGTSSIGNSQAGVVIADGANNNSIGGTAAGAGNIISGNGPAGGISIQIGAAAGAVPPFENKVQGNKIGTNAAGDSALPNTGNGIALIGATTTLIGGVSTDIPNARNIISGNGMNGISLSMAANQNRISGNYVGTKADGVTALGNVERGIRVGDSVSGTVIGGPETNAGNTIAFNGSNGISLTSDAGNNNIIDPNRIFGNVLAGIDIGENGFTPNDPADADIGPNKLQNFPTFSLSLVGGDLIVSYQVDSAPQHSTYGGSGIYVEFFEADASGAGRNFLGSDHYLLSDFSNGTPGTRTKNLGNAVAVGVVAGDKLTATATDDDGNSSEFTPAVNAPGGAAGFEGDVTPRAAPDGVVLTTDVTQIRRFVTGLDTLNASVNEGQRADCAPRTTFGDGAITSSDVVQARRYVTGLDPLTPAAGPQVTAPVPVESLLSRIDDPFAFLYGRQIGIGAGRFDDGGRITIPVEMTTYGDEAGLSFTLEYDVGDLSDPRVSLGEAVPADSVLTVNTNENGRIGILVDSDEPMIASNVSKAIVLVTFNVSPTAIGDPKVSLSGSLAPLSISDREGNVLKFRYRNSTAGINGW